MAENLIGSEIIKLAGEINARIQQGEHIYNFTIGDFDPKVFPIPMELEEEIIRAYRNKQTNYPAANGIETLRSAVQSFLKRGLSLDYDKDEILISGGGRPLIYAAYITLIDPGDKIIYPVPSWNNNHYTHLCGGVGIEIETTAEQNFMPTAADLLPHVQDATLIALCSPLNPTGTAFTKDALLSICELIRDENKRRGPGKKPLYLLYDQLYWTLTFGDTEHVDPVSLCPEIRDYTIYIDGLSKAFAATGVRVGWSFGPKGIIGKMRAILSHIGAWSPKPEQVASAAYLDKTDAVDQFLTGYKQAIHERLDGFYRHFQRMKASGLPVDCIAPQAAIYLTVKIDLRGAQQPDGKVIQNMGEVTAYLLESAKLAIVPFYAFGTSNESPWFRLSVGTCKLDDVDASMFALEKALGELKY